MKQFLHQTQQKIGEKSNQFLNELGKKIDTAQNFVEQSKDILSTVAINLKNRGEKFKATVMKTAETTLRGAGDEVEGFFSEVPNRVNDGFDEILGKLGEACSWILRNIIAPILFIITLLALTYIFIISGCCGCCCSTLLSHFGVTLGNTFKQLKKDKHLRQGDRIIILRDLETSIPLQGNESFNNRQLSKNNKK
ncbi:Protein adenylyltransferase VbhT [Dirofilaria immitis]